MCDGNCGTDLMEVPNWESWSVIDPDNNDKHFCSLRCMQSWLSEALAA